MASFDHLLIIGITPALSSVEARLEAGLAEGYLTNFIQRF